MFQKIIVTKIKMQKTFMLLVALTLLSMGIVEAGSKKQSPKIFGRNLDLNELQANYVGKLYVAPGTVVPNHLSNLQV